MIARETQWGDFQGVRTFESPQELPEDYAKFLKRLLYVQADTEFASVQQHRPWLDRSPSLDDRWTEARIVADEMRHGYQICKLLQDFGPEGDAMIDDLLNRHMGEHKLDSFNMEFEKWSDVAAFAMFVDRVGIYQLRSFQGCSYGPLSRAIPLMLAEEQLHIGFGANALKRIATDDSYYGDKAEAQEAINKWFPRALDMFGHSDSEGSELAVRLGIKKWKNDEARQMYLEEVERIITGMGLELPDPTANRRVLQDWGDGRRRFRPAAGCHTMSYLHLHLSVANGVARLTLDRPPLNVMTIAVMREMQAAVDALADAPGLHALVLAGAGKAFSAGVDVGEHLGDTYEPMLAEFHAVFERLEALALPTVAVVHGAALGGGCELAGFCDFLLAADTARLGFPEITLGVFPPVAAAVLPLRLGHRAMLRLVLTGEVVDAREAQALGLVSQVVPEGELAAATEALLGRLRGLSGAALRATRRAMWAAEGGWRARLARAEAVYRDELMATHDATEGLRAFLEKRPPVWQDA